MINVRNRVLFISSRSDIAGGEVYLLNVMRHLDRSRFDPIVVIPGAGSFQRALDEVRVPSVIVEAHYGWLAPPLPWYQLMSTMSIRVARLRQLIVEKNVALVHTNSNQILEGALAAKLSGVHHVHMAQVEFQPNIPLYERFPLDQASFAALMGELSAKVIAVSNQVYQTFCPPLHKEHVKLIYNGVDFHLLDSSFRNNGHSVRKELGISDHALVITGIGRLNSDKGFDCLLEAAARVIKQEARDTRLLLVGVEEDRLYAERLRKQTADLGIESLVHFLGFRNDVSQVLSETDIFVLSSRREGHPFVLLEAMGSGCAAVATRCGGVEDTVKDRETGLLVDIEDTAEMAIAMNALAKDKQLRKQIGSAARKEVRKRFDAKQSVAALMEVYEEALGLPRPVAGSVAVDLFLRAARELGTLGVKVTELDERLRQVEHLTRWVRQSSIYRSARQVNRWIRGAPDEG